MDRKESRDHNNSRKRRNRSPSRSPSRSHSKSYASVKSKQIKEDISLNIQREELLTGKGNDERPVANSTNDTSISIEETNRIRAELGLKPLEIGGENSNVEASTEKKDVHVPAENLREKKATEELRRKLDERREKRQIEQKLAQVRTLAHTTADDDDNAVSWVEKSRRIQKEKEEANKRAKMLEEMDEAFGVGDMLTTELIKQKAKAYTSRDLRGIKVEHDREMIAEGKEVVLTLKDQNILQEEGDVLVNVNLVDIERYKKNNEIKKQRPGYQPYEEEEVDELGLPKPKLLLAKYDTEIEGEKHDSFVLGKIGDEEAKMKAQKLMKDKLKLQQKKIESLESRPLQIASEYYTAEEMVSFKKVKRRVKKVRSKGDGILKADDLIQETQETTSSDLGSRSRKKRMDEEVTEDLSGFKITVDESQKEIRQALLKANKLKERKADQWDMNMITRSLKREPLEETEGMEEDPLKSSIILNATAEFCRTLGDIPTYGMAGNRDEDEDELMDFERQLAEERRRNQEKEERKREAERLQERGGWNVLERENDQGSDDSMDVDRNEKDNATVILDEEPDVGSGMAAALKLAMSKGYLEKQEKKRIVISKSAQELQAQRYTIEDKAAEDDKYSRRNRFDGPVVEFKDKEGYKPLPKLEYIDDNGKAMSTKEAFRHLSHKFHGKGSGKLKSEKRAKKDEDKMLMNRMSSTDTPLNTLKKLQDKQKELQSPYVVLSGKMAPTSIVKPGKGKK
ncbi:hypothetical protein DAPPUDRAFT_306323 [Daphnia pulex]|uniref:U4/U6.U5 tri-snRNP-associated protein 1 n=1 Tax=Daphnia pulex TaxID=6669 RepID=E9GWZ8_DAPPU|nr:hypothetical protein DAPPUDRAFT_306323 [Daphnia pulex]|eukprot:EFX76024.1 hypothetical protein DAPPUDRAFT_306323 [Daphnia pulex]